VRKERKEKRKEERKKEREREAVTFSELMAEQRSFIQLSRKGYIFA